MAHHERPVGQVVKTPPFHGGNTGSNPVRVTIFFIRQKMNRQKDSQCILFKKGLWCSG